MSSTNNPLAAQDAGGFQSLTRPPITNFTVKNVPAPTNVYIADDAFLRVSVRNLGAGVSLTVHTRVLRSEDGIITASEDVIVPASSGAQQFTFINLTEGFLLSASITSDTGVTLRGQTFVTLELCHGNTVSPHRDQTLIQDYTATGYTASWPGGLLRLATEGPGVINASTVGNPGAGNELTFGMVANSRSSLRTMRMTFTTSAAVGNRLPTFLIIRGGSTIYSVTVAAAIVASTAAIIQLNSAVVAPRVDGLVHTLPIPSNLILNGPPQVNSSTAGLDPADAYTSINAISESWVDS
jgi:hypothetical protein